MVSRSDNTCACVLFQKWIRHETSVEERYTTINRQAICSCPEADKRMSLFQRSGLISEKKFTKKFSTQFVDPNEFLPGIRKFLENWDTKILSSVEIRQESRLFEHFFRKTPHGSDVSANHLTFYRTTTEKYEVALVGNNIDRDFSEYPSDFYDDYDKQVENLSTTKAKKYRDKTLGAEKKEVEKLTSKKMNSTVEATIEMYFLKAMKRNIPLNTRGLFSHFFKAHIELWNFYLIDPSLVKRLTLTPSIWKIQSALNFGGIQIMQTFVNKKESTQ